MRQRLLPAFILLSSSALAATPHANPLVTVPQTDSTLSVLQPKDGKLAWLRIDPVSGKSAVVAIAPRRQQISWSFDGQEAVLWTPVEDANGHPDRTLVRVNVATGEVQLVRVPKTGDLGWVGIDAHGAIHAYTWLDIEDTNTPDGKFHFDGKAYEIPDGPGSPGLVNDYRLTPAGRWKHVHSEGSTEEADDAPGIEGGIRINTLGPTTFDHIYGTEAMSDEDVPDSLEKKLDAAVPRSDMPNPGHWAPLKTQPRVAYGLGVDNSVQDWLASACVAVVLRGRVHVLPVPGLGKVKAREWDSDLFVRGPFVLIEPGGVASRLFDVRTAKLVYKSKAPVFLWPRPAHRR